MLTVCSSPNGNSKYPWKTYAKTYYPVMLPHTFVCFKETPVFVTFLSGPIQGCFFLPGTVNSAESTADNGEAT